tara:strand:+ start:89 stop:511 length:423 start_codon:yes stop_codon:yes gene_type:complete
MTVNFCIIPERGLVVVRYSDFAAIDDTMAASKAYLAHPDYAAGQKQLVDFTNITGYEKDYVRFMNLQAAKAEQLGDAGEQWLVVYVAPTPLAQDVSAMFIRSWADVFEVVVLVQHSEAEALALLGQPEKTIDALLATLVK